MPDRRSETVRPDPGRVRSLDCRRRQCRQYTAAIARRRPDPRRPLATRCRSPASRRPAAYTIATGSTHTEFLPSEIVYIKMPVPPEVLYT